MNFSSKSLVSTLLVIICIALGYFFVLPKWNDYSLAQTELASKKLEQKQLEDAKARLDSLLAEYKEHTKEAQDLSRALPLSKEEMYNILNDLDSVTKVSGVSLAQLSVKDTPEADQLGAEEHSIQPIDLTVSGSGSYASITNFLTKLEDNLRLMDINSVTISEENNLLNFDLQFRSYYQK